MWFWSWFQKRTSKGLLNKVSILGICIFLLRGHPHLYEKLEVNSRSASWRYIFTSNFAAKFPNSAWLRPWVLLVMMPALLEGAMWVPPEGQDTAPCSWAPRELEGLTKKKVFEENLNFASCHLLPSNFSATCDFWTQLLLVDFKLFPSKSGFGKLPILLISAFPFNSFFISKFSDSHFQKNCKSYS